MPGTIEQRTNFFGLTTGRRGIGIILFGVNPKGEITEDTPHRDGFHSVNVDKELSVWFKALKDKASDYCHYKTLHEEISIYGPASLDADVLFEYVMLSGFVDIEDQLKLLIQVRDKPAGAYFENSLHTVMGGRNSFNLLNIAIDFDHDAIVIRRNARLSLDGFEELAQNPFRVLKERYKLPDTCDRINATQINEEVAAHLAFEYVRKKFFTTR